MKRRSVEAEGEVSPQPEHPYLKLSEPQKEDLKRRIHEFLQIPEVRRIEIQNLAQAILVAIREQPASNIQVRPSENLPVILQALRSLGLETRHYSDFGYVDGESEEPEDYTQVLFATSKLTLSYFTIFMDDWQEGSWNDPEMAKDYGYFMGFPKTAVAAFAALLPNLPPIHKKPEEPVYPPFGRFRYSDENFTQEFQFLLSRNIHLYQMSPEIFELLFELLIEQQEDEEGKNLLRTFVAYAQGVVEARSTT